jgi:hypothetical protein
MPLFPTATARPSTASEPAARWLAAARRGLDVLVAFATLRDAEEPGDRRARGAAVVEPWSPEPWGPGGIAADRAAERDRPARSTSGGGASRTSAAARVTHPHRRPLRTAPRARRPGTVEPSDHVCVTPLAAPRPPRLRDREVGRRL